MLYFVNGLNVFNNMRNYFNDRLGFVRSGAPVLQWQDDRVQKCQKHPMVLTAQNASVAQTYVGVTYLSFMKSMKTQNGALCVHRRHICAWPKHLNICISLFGGGQTLTFEKYEPGRYQTMKYIICDVLGVRKYASGGRINNFSELCLKAPFSHLAL